MNGLFVAWVAFGARITETAALLTGHVVAPLWQLAVLFTDGWKCYPPRCSRLWAGCISRDATGRWAANPCRVLWPRTLFTRKWSKCTSAV